MVGQNGSGKSFLAQRYLADWRYANVMALNTKGEPIEKFWPDLIDEGLPVPEFTRFRDLEKFGSGKCVYTPDWREMKPDYYNAFFELVYERTNTTAWVDEVYNVAKGQTLPEFYLACLTRGRSRNVQCWNLTQRPMQVPNFIFSESKHFYVFLLLLGGDRKKLAEFLGDQVLENPQGEFGFWYKGPKMRAPIEVTEGI